MTAMRRGDFSAAWEVSDRVLAERSVRGVDCSRWPRHLQYLWDGSPLDGKHVFVRCYHGLGDTIQYVRFLEALRRRVTKVTLSAQPALLSLLRHLRGYDVLVPLHDGHPGFDYDIDIELMELAHALRIAPDDLPGPVPYIRLPGAPERAQRRDSALHVGIAWRSGDWDPSRSVPSDALQTLRGLEGIAFYSLQFPPEALPIAADQLACLDIERMAQRMRSLDVVISVDTMISHLAGALGLPTWVLLNEQPDWRWMDQRDDTPWYPTMRLFRKREENWTTVIATVRDQLETLLAHQGEPFRLQRSLITSEVMPIEIGISAEAHQQGDL